jgi:hypothetical protein
MSAILFGKKRGFSGGWIEEYGPGRGDGCIGQRQREWHVTHSEHFRKDSKDDNVHFHMCLHRPVGVI